MARRGGESQRGVEQIYVLILFFITSSFFVPVTEIREATLEQKEEAQITI
jgi:hypothetical protein